MGQNCTLNVNFVDGAQHFFSFSEILLKFGSISYKFAILFIMKRSFFFVFTVNLAVWANPISLSEAIEMAKIANSEIKAEKAKVEAAEGGESEALSRLMPKISLSAGITKINDPIYIDLGQIQGALSGLASGLGSSATAAAYSKAYIDSYTAAVGSGLSAEQASGIALQNASTYSEQTRQQTAALKNQIDNADFNYKVQDDLFLNARLSVVWPIFTGLKIYSAYDAAKENVHAKQAAFEAVQNKILKDVASKYFTLRLTEELTALRESTKNNLEEHLKRSEKLEAGGQISKAERLRAEVALAEAENALEDARRDQTLAKIALATILRTDTNLTATTPVSIPPEKIPLAELKKTAVERHPGIRQLRTERKRSRDAVQAARADYFPTIALFGYKELYTRDLTLLEPEWAVGAKLQWDLFSGGETRSKVSSAKAIDRSLGSMEEQIAENIGLLVEKLWREMEHAEHRLESLNKTRELALESHRSQILAYEAGLATGLDVVDAELALSRLQVADLKARYDAVLAWLGLLESCGNIEQAGEMMTNVKNENTNHLNTERDSHSKNEGKNIGENPLSRSESEEK